VSVPCRFPTFVIVESPRTLEDRNLDLVVCRILILVLIRSVREGIPILSFDLRRRSYFLLADNADEELAAPL